MTQWSVVHRSGPEHAARRAVAERRVDLALRALLIVGVAALLTVAVVLRASSRTIAAWSIDKPVRALPAIRAWDAGVRGR